MKRPNQFKLCAWMFSAVCGVSIAGLTLPANVLAQGTKKAPAKKDDPADAPATKKSDAAKKESKPAKRSDDDERGEPQKVQMETTDHVIIEAYYFPPLRPDKNTPAVILLHDYGQKQSVFWPTNDKDKDLAFVLQNKGYAVLTFDFRGHGRSTNWVGKPGGAAQKGAPKLDLSEFRTPAQLTKMLEDIEAGKRFLVRQNNRGEINVSKLGVVGCEMGASLGVLWSFRDWSFKPQPGFSHGKQGEDVQAIVLVSPQYNFKGLSINHELNGLQQIIPIQVVVGKKDTKAFGEADKMFQAAKRARPNESDTRLTELDVKIQGSKLLNPDYELNAQDEIVKFFDATLKKKGGKWELRELSDEEKAGGP